MNSERFRFRAWDKDFTEMTYFEMGDLLFGDTPIGDYEPNHYAIMQCTGLKDKNGKLIYEGDVVKAREYYKQRSLSVIKHCPKRCGFALYIPITDEWFDFIDPYADDIEVIGNIYEDKHLLKKGGE